METNQEVKEIVDFIYYGRGQQYIIKQEGQPYNTNTEEPLEYLDRVKEAITVFKRYIGKIYLAYKYITYREYTRSETSRLGGG